MTQVNSSGDTHYGNTILNVNQNLIPAAMLLNSQTERGSSNNKTMCEDSVYVHINNVKLILCSSFNFSPRFNELIEDIKI